jgi:diadenosine tetraphosphate (Ap4A) HIT family hydrolase
MQKADNITSSAKCIFCEVIEENNSLLYSDERICVFEDKFPKGKIHLLVIPIEHIRHVGDLSKKHIDLLEHMYDIGKRIIEDKTENPRERNFKYGFHKGKCIGVAHLHLHCILLPYLNKCKGCILFNCMSFKSYQSTLTELKAKKN